MCLFQNSTAQLNILAESTSRDHVGRVCTSDSLLPCLSRHIQVLTDWNQSQRIICDKTDETLLLAKVRWQPIIRSPGIEPKRIQHTGLHGRHPRSSWFFEAGRAPQRLSRSATCMLRSIQSPSSLIVRFLADRRQGWWGPLRSCTSPTSCQNLQSEYPRATQYIISAVTSQDHYTRPTSSRSSNLNLPVKTPNSRIR